MMQDERFRFSFEHALEIMFLFDKNGKIVCANESARQQLEYGEELVGCSVSEIFPNHPFFMEGKTEKNFTDEWELEKLEAYRKNRTCFPVSARIFKYDSSPFLFLCTAVNRTEQLFLEKKANQVAEEVESALKVRSEFVANVTHELRTPVNGILGNIMELMDKETEEEKKKLLRLVERGCRDMNAIINNVLDFSKLNAGKFTLEPRKFHFRNMIDYVRSNHINKITEKGLELFITVSPEVPEYVIGDELRIVQILNNLLSNACKFTSVGKIIVEVVKTAQINGKVELFFLVLDSGIGIDKADLDKLFKSFSQVDASISRKYGGTGLGLSICKQLVELMDGSIHVESERNKGTTFSFHIWLEIPKEEWEKSSGVVDKEAVLDRIQGLSEENVNQNIWKYGEAENQTEIKRKMSKLILSVELENWEKAEMFMDTIKQLTAEAPREVKNEVLRLKMAVQKSDYDKITTAFDALKELI